MIMNIYELSEKLQVSVSGIYTWVNQKKIPFIKVGRLVRFDSDKIDQWLSENEIKTEHGIKLRKKRKYDGRVPPG